MGLQTLDIYLPLSTYPHPAQHHFVDPKQIFPIRLKQARSGAEMSLRRLSGALNGLVTAQGIQKYEQGRAMPGSGILLALAKALGRPLEYFFRPLGPEIESISLRKHARVGKKRETAICETVRDHVERYLELEEFVDSRTRFTRPQIQMANDAEAVAEAIREKWKLGTNPLPRVVEMLEENGVRVIEIQGALGRDQRFNGCSGKADQVAFIVLAEWLNSNLPRKRFTALHELGHLLLDCRHLPSKQGEQLCNRFAGAMLLPAEPLRASIGRKRGRVSLEELCLLEREHGISIGAILHRLEDLDIISSRHYRDWQIKLRKKGWHRKDSAEYIGEERALRFDRLLARALAEELISTSKAAALSNRSIEAARTELVGS